jgi:Hint-domain/U-box domain/von Willebrand factor type A domain/VWA / Hh  protein intein-like
MSSMPSSTTPSIGSAIQIPDSYRCPIGTNIMRDPVIDPTDGKTYDRANLIQWLVTNRTSPQTRQPLTAAQLIPNRALKDVIDAALAAGMQDSSGGGPPATAPVSFISRMMGGGGAAAADASAHSSHMARMMGSYHGNSDPRYAPVIPPATLDVKRVPGTDYYHLVVSAPDTGPENTLPITCVLVVDNSGSMNRSSVANNTELTAAYSRKDLVVHGVNGIIGSIDSRHALGIVNFSDDARVTLSSCIMSPANKIAARAAANQIGAIGSTNLHSGLMAGLREIEAIWREFTLSERKRKNIIVIQTDGDTDEPPCEGGIAGALTTWMRAHPDIDLTVHTLGYGFGSDLCTDKLERITTVGKGLPLYISDGNMAVSAITHLLANCTSALYSNIRICIPETGQVVELGDLQGGKPRSLLLKIPKTNFNVQVMSGPTTIVSAAVVSDATTAAGPEAEVTAIHQGLVTAMQEALVLARRADFTGASRALDDWYAATTSSPAASHPMVVAMLTDVRHDDTTKGQISLGVRTAHNWERWGQHFLPQSIGQHRSMWATDFKGTCSEVYRQGTMKAQYLNAVAICNNLPPPTMSCAHQCAPTIVHAARAGGARALFDPAGGCWAPGTMILLEDGMTRQPVETLRTGDMVWTPVGPARVEHVLVLGRNNTHQQMCTYGTLCITPYHPILVNGTWTTACQFGPSVSMYMPTVYNLILDQGHVVNANSVLTCTLGHGMTGPVIGHDFFGNKTRILAAVSKQPGFAEGRPVYVNLVPIYNMTSGLITDWRDDIFTPAPEPVLPEPSA